MQSCKSCKTNNRDIKKDNRIKFVAKLFVQLYIRNSRNWSEF